MEKEPITLNGLKKLKDELIFLKEKKRPEIVAAIADARSHGDLKENAEYHAAKEEQSHNEGRITEINDIIARANVIDVTKLNNDGKVIFGCTVFLENLDSNEKINYKIVGKDEADLKQKLISYFNIEFNPSNDDILNDFLNSDDDFSFYFDNAKSREFIEKLEAPYLNTWLPILENYGDKVIVKTAFNHRRKTLRNSLKVFNLSDNLREDSIFDLRPEQLSIDNFVKLTNMINSQ